ncbi:MAG: PAS domain-containing protein [Desulfarculaceae bacterium]
MLHPGEQRWAQRLAKAQTAKDELVKLIGLINVLNGISARESSLRVATGLMVQNLITYLDLRHCLFYLGHGPNLDLMACSGQGDSAHYASMIEARLGEGSTYACQVEDQGVTYPVHCLPVNSGGEHLGTVVLVLERELDFKGRRELRLVSDAITPVLETFMLRIQVHEANQKLRQALKRSSRGFVKVKQEKLKAQACVEGLMDRAGSPLFITNRQGRLVRFNLDLERLLGWEREYLQAKCLSDFFSDPSLWEDLSARSSHSPDAACQETVELVVQAGHILQAQMDLTPVFCGEKCSGFLGQFRPTQSQVSSSQQALTWEESLALADVSEEMVNEMNELLMAMQSNVQLLMHYELDGQVRKRLELLENMSMDGARAVRRVQKGVDRVRDRCRKSAALRTLWGDIDSAVKPEISAV